MTVYVQNAFLKNMILLSNLNIQIFLEICFLQKPQNSSALHRRLKSWFLILRVLGKKNTEKRKQKVTCANEYNLVSALEWENNFLKTIIYEKAKHLS